jgi:enoyl-CoA hydratase/carnithine racemase
VDLHDLGALVGPAGERTIEASSVLSQPEPLILHVAERPPRADAAAAANVLRRAPTVVVVMGDPAVVPADLVAAADVALTEAPDPPAPWHADPPVATREAVAAQPLAALALVSLLRVSAGLPVWDAVAAEAATYAMLLGSDAHRRWLAARPEPAPDSPPRPDRPPVAVRRFRDGAVLTLDRYEVHNAVNTEMRDLLVATLAWCAEDPLIGEVHLRGKGRSFSAGGDLTEFGTVPDAATSYAVRLTRHPGLAVHRVADITRAWVHGHCVGAGCEIPAFASRVHAAPNARFRLPELSMGLVPGAGGTVSLARRIGRHRTAWLALTGVTLDAATALRWGLVDRIVPRSEWP